ncbi:RNA methyltransferase [Flavipsychrobacter stenotrophus]|uniref:RNA methyltransferase n=1 Tax=Flavipsychrobacter stenotrophus TaxID=2077091 RepID=A0A2S7SQ75_9BACT|nr:RNA methyltransferase [Flavipsychrobacter stenotrophus]PQJ08716.1 RNA methyltransferase [Flavipsychrobacter stenotrophus]
MLSKTQSKYIRSLTHQKFRNEHKVFIAEGTKIAEEWLRSDARIQKIVATQLWVDGSLHLIALHPEAELHIADEAELLTVSSLSTPNQVLLVVYKKDVPELKEMEEWCLALDNIQDPGNMGTIIRIADWFGINHIVCGEGCVDVYNPKVVQSSMGGHLRVNLYETDLEAFLSNSKIPVIAATLDGQNIYTTAKPTAGILVIGNESKGVSAKVLAQATHKVMIPRLGGAESLNAGVSAGIICALLLQP